MHGASSGSACGGGFEKQRHSSIIVFHGLRSPKSEVKAAFEMLVVHCHVSMMTQGTVDLTDKGAVVTI